MAASSWTLRAGRQVESGNGQRSQFVQAQPGVDEGAVDENPFVAQSVQLLDHIGAQIGGAFASSLSGANRTGVIERPTRGHRKQSSNFVGCQCSALPTRVESAVGNGNAGEVVFSNPLRRGKPVRERRDILPVIVPGGRTHLIGNRFSEQLLDLVSAEIAERFELEFITQPTNGAIGVRTVHSAHFRNDERLKVGIDLQIDGAGRGASGMEFVRIENTSGNLLRFLLPFGELRTGVRFVAASGRALDGAAGVVAKRA